jgi:hypothetical protein
MANSVSWQKIFDDYNILNHDFKKTPFKLTAKQIKKSCQNFTETSEKEVRILCKQDTREKRPDIFLENNLFLLPIKNGFYVIIQGEGYFDIPEITSDEIIYNSKLNFELESSKIGDSEMQHLDFAYASSLIRTFMNDESLVLTIRGRKYTPEFTFYVNSQKINVSGVQTEVDAGYEGKDKIVLVEAKNSNSKNTIIRQLYYPYKQWTKNTSKNVSLLFFEKKENTYYVWEYIFKDKNDYNSIKLVKSAKYTIKQNLDN